MGCKQCGGPFPAGRRRVYCSKTCSRRAWKVANRDRAILSPKNEVRVWGPEEV